MLLTLSTLWALGSSKTEEKEKGVALRAHSFLLTTRNSTPIVFLRWCSLTTNVRHIPRPHDNGLFVFPSCVVPWDNGLTLLTWERTHTHTHTNTLTHSHTHSVPVSGSVLVIHCGWFLTWDVIGRIHSTGCAEVELYNAFPRSVVETMCHLTVISQCGFASGTRYNLEISWACVNADCSRSHLPEQRPYFDPYLVHAHTPSDTHILTHTHTFSSSVFHPPALLSPFIGDVVSLHILQSLSPLLWTLFDSCCSTPVTHTRAL